MIKKIFLVVLFITALLSAQSISDENNQYMLAQNYIQSGMYAKAEPILQKLYKEQPGNYEYFSSLNKVYTQLKDYDASIALIEDKMKLSQPDINLYGMLGTTYYIKGNEKEAFKTWDDALKSLPKNEANYRVIANYALDRRAFDKAIVYLKKGQDISSNPIYFAYDLGNLYSLTMQYKDATDEYCFILTKYPTQLGSIESKILSYINKPGALEQSLPVVEKYANSSEVNFKFLLARLYIENKSYNKAYDVYKDIEDIQKDQGAQLLSFAQFLYGEKIYKTSAKVFSDIINNFPNSAIVSTAKLGYAKTLEALLDENSSSNSPLWKPYYKITQNNSSEIDKVISAYLEINKLYPHSEVAYEALLRIGNIKLDREMDIKGAEKYFNMIIEDSPLSKYTGDAYSGLAQAAILNGDLKTASMDYSKIISNKRNSKDLINLAGYQLARISFYQGDFAKTKKNLSDILNDLKSNTANDALELSLLMNTSQNDSSNLMIFASGELLAEQKKFGEAGNKYKLVAADPIKFMLQNLAYFRLGEMYLAMNNLDSAISVFQKITDEDNKNIYADKALYLLGEIYQFGLNNKVKAKEAYENLLAKFPNSLYLDDARAKIVKLKDNKLDRME